MSNAALSAVMSMSAGVWNRACVATAGGGGGGGGGGVASRSSMVRRLYGGRVLPLGGLVTPCVALAGSVTRAGLGMGGGGSGDGAGGGGGGGGDGCGGAEGVSLQMSLLHRSELSYLSQAGLTWWIAGSLDGTYRRGMMG